MSPISFRGVRVAIILLVVIAAAGCSATSALNVLQSADGVATARAVSYAEGDRHRLDVYAPKRADGSAPVVVFFYGGSWDSGDREMYRFVGNALASRGFVAIIPDYRVYPEVRYPAFLRDSARAVRWAREHAGEYGGNAEQLILMGHSAGAYNAAMLTVDARWLREVGLRPDRHIAAMIGLAGPYDFLPLRDETLEAIFAPADDIRDTQPINRVEGGTPPVLLAAARGDETVDPGNTARFADRLREAGGSVEERYFQGLSHALMIGVMADPLSGLAPVREDVTEFVRSLPAR